LRALVASERALVASERSLRCERASSRCVASERALVALACNARCVGACKLTSARCVASERALVASELSLRCERSHQITRPLRQAPCRNKARRFSPAQRPRPAAQLDAPVPSVRACRNMMYMFCKCFAICDVTHGSQRSVTSTFSDGRSLHMCAGYRNLACQGRRFTTGTAVMLMLYYMLCSRCERALVTLRALVARERALVASELSLRCERSLRASGLSLRASARCVASELSLRASGLSLRASARCVASERALVALRASELSLRWRMQFNERSLRWRI
jgi:hypothetical protein